ncbi:MAG: methyltransferase domain-containing protein [Clostridia bacterium]|nr:methyltransferase domain-containing protein [Clostridia bacterium]
MNLSTVSLLKCPICSAQMQADDTGKSVRCKGEKPHCYDLSRSGYLNLTHPKDGVGDSKAAVQARRLFLSGGYYKPLSDRINQILEEQCVHSVLDAGCGEGYYTNRMQNGKREVLGIDLSRDGIDAAARYAKQNQTGVCFAVGSIFTLPVQAEAFDAVTNLFAPCAEQEFLRVLKPGGTLILIGAGERHLFGLKETLYEDPYLNPGRADLPAQMRQIDRQRLTYTINVEGEEQIAALFSMTPYYWRTSEADKQKLHGLTSLQTQVDFDIYLFRKDPIQ